MNPDGPKQCHGKIIEINLELKESRIKTNLVNP